MHGPPDGVLARSPDLGLLEQLVDRAAAVEAGADRRQAADFLAHRPEHQWRCLALLHQAVEGAGQTADVAGEQGFTQAVDVVAGDVEHGVADLRITQLAGRVKQGQFLDFLVRGKQVALDAFGDELQAFRIGALLLPAQPAGDPAGQFGERRGVELDGDAGVGERREPGCLLLAPVEFGQGDQQQVVGRQVLAPLLQRGAAFLARLAGGDAQVDQFLVAEQREVAAGSE
ncbi:hypothetical protein SDC9_173283 [bioreactor metagenome]|uniref:Uncharacterized protein n=1 Tax=bioreactor metagenome TaxID=1076179 RepID=A0A645GGQ3_9ZZZZ